MKNKIRIAAAVLVGLGLTVALVLFVRSFDVPVIESKGLIAHEQRNLIIFTVILSLFVILPVYTLTAVFAWRYRERNKKANHSPDWEKHNGIEAVMWAIPRVAGSVDVLLALDKAHNQLYEPYGNTCCNNQYPDSGYTE